MRVAAVSYLNALPLLDGLPWAIDRDVPSAFTRERREQYDLLLTSVVVAFDDPDWEILYGAPAIGCRGAVGSVRLDLLPGYTIDTATRILLSRESQTANRLLQVLLAHRWLRDLRTIECALTHGRPHARLVIGDAAFTTPPTALSVDLGETWWQWQQHPFLFACWMKRRGVTCDVTPLEACCRNNLDNLSQLFARHRLDDTMRPYFTERLSYRFGPEERRGLETFRAFSQSFCSREHSRHTGS